VCYWKKLPAQGIYYLHLQGRNGKNRERGGFYRITGEMNAVCEDREK
jgi:hypothetical protein